MSRDAVTDGQPRSGLERRVAAAAETLLTRSKSVSPVDVLAAIGWLPASLVDQWRRGRVECLERVAPVHPDKLASALEHPLDRSRPVRGGAGTSGPAAEQGAGPGGRRAAQRVDVHRLRRLGLAIVH